MTEANLPALVREVRAALGDDARSPRYIRTLQRFGYAFCGAIDSPVARGEDVGSGPVFSLVWGTRDIHLREGENILGRTREVAIPISSPSVSRHHARIVVAGDRAVLEDLDSKNGTRVGGKKVSAPTLLEDNDEIRFGSVVMTFRAVSTAGSTRTGDGN